jgi:diamine N-acetyltransferase
MSSVNLRALTLEDAKITWEWRNKEEISNLYSGHPFPVNYELEKAWYEKVMRSNLPTTVFAVEIIENNLSELIGLTTLTNINLINRTSDFSILIGDDKHRGKGYSKEATIKTLLFGFNELGLNRIALRVREGNDIALNLYKKIGFETEGILKQNVFRNNNYHNEIAMAILKKDFVK